MIIYGTRATTGHPIHTGETCPACGKEQTIEVIPQQQYFHIFWIPVFPLKKYFTPYCTDCSATFDASQTLVTPEVRRQYGTPKWTFIGLAIIIAVIITAAVTGAIDSEANKKDMLAKIENPQAGDIYQIHFESNEYSAMKITEVGADTIYFIYAEYAVNKKSGIDKILKMNQYDEDEWYGFTKEELKNLVDSQKIFKIGR